MDDLDAFARVVVYDLEDTRDTRVFTQDIKMALSVAGVGEPVGPHKIDSIVNRLYGTKEFPPVYATYRKDGMKGMGWSHLGLIQATQA